MIEKSFIQRSRLGRRLFIINDNYLIVSGKHGLRQFETSFDLRDLAPRFERIRGRFFVLVLYPLFLAALILVVGNAIAVHLYLWAPLIHLLKTGLIVLFMILAIKGFRLLEIVRFRSRRGIVLFDIVKDRAQSEEFENFIKELRSRIESDEK